MHAARYHHFPIMKNILRVAKARPDGTLERLVNAIDTTGNTALHYATGGAIWHQDVSKGLSALTYNRRTSFEGWCGQFHIQSKLICNDS
jgi:hypothetical protein